MATFLVILFYNQTQMIVSDVYLPREHVESKEVKSNQIVLLFQFKKRDVKKEI